ncbi:MAG: DUF3592 domain-containing protein, partial [Clostridia bacterium]|nr:DUF3592 domain-containing protein [Clostridia bacterium]
MFIMIFMYISITLAGWILLIAGLRVNRGKTRKDEDERSLTTGTIISTEDKGTKHLKVQYRVNGKVYTEELNGNVPPEMIGKIIDVYYNSNEPSSFHIEALQKKRKTSVLAVIGAIWIAIGTIVFAGVIPLASRGRGSEYLFRRWEFEI